MYSEVKKERGNVGDMKIFSYFCISKQLYNQIKNNNDYGIYQ